MGYISGQAKGNPPRPPDIGGVGGQGGVGRINNQFLITGFDINRVG
ncbi:hypothetical protein N44_02043 [Microcystis aeruginosa NIES-44]|uniref:Uncharacterized protein n=1 Tax=Microcystis aeruginosa NIES-44 TaxID=449439 RepID=A0A0A1VVQ4_MICAE|nr:hypothetical protein N44_02043 [Microcystis aeruginosa NIES-44]